MSNFKLLEDEPMPINKLLLVKNDYGQTQLRMLYESGELYDENEILDDSEIDIVSWCEIPK